MESHKGPNMKCCICGHGLTVPISDIRRESPLCGSCGSNARFRGVVLAILRHVFRNEGVPLIEQKPRPDVKSLGMSDSDSYAKLLAEKLTYVNTYQHQPPLLDVCDPRSVEQFNEYDLIVSSDVIEHTRDPPHIVLRRMRQMLSEDGIVVLSTPTYDLRDSIEWYPNAKNLEVLTQNDRHIVKWQNQRGVTYVDDHPNFHGGPGDTLEMRISTPDGLFAAARQAGFSHHTLEFDESVGYIWPLTATGDPVVPGPIDSRIVVLRPQVDSEESLSWISRSAFGNFIRNFWAGKPTQKG